MSNITLNKEICKFCRSKRLRPFQPKDEVMWNEKRINCQFGLNEVDRIFPDKSKTLTMNEFLEATTRWTNEPPPDFCPYIAEHTVVSDNMIM
jgi:hypothetical protein